MTLAPRTQLWVGVAVLVLLLLATLYLVSLLLSLFSSADGNVQASIVAGLFAFGAALINWNYQRKKSELDRHKEQKIGVYGKLIGFLNNYQKHARKEGEEASAEYLQSDEVFDFFWDMGRELVLWASPGVVKAYYAAFKETTPGEPGTTLARVDKLYKEIRKDLGLSNWGLGKYDLVGVMVNDIDNLRSE